MEKTDAKLRKTEESHCAQWRGISIAHTQCLISADSKAAFLTHVILLGHGPCFTHVKAEDLRPERHYSMYQSSLEITRAVSQLPTPPLHELSRCLQHSPGGQASETYRNRYSDHIKWQKEPLLEK